MIDEEYKQLEMKVKLLNQEVEESLERERMVASEVARVVDYSKDIFNKEVAIRPEVERYMMMVEELKQKLNDSTITSINLSTLVKDSQIIQRLTMKSLIEQKIMFDVFIDKLEQHINKMEVEFLTLANVNYNNYIKLTTKQLFEQQILYLTFQRKKYMNLNIYIYKQESRESAYLRCYQEVKGCLEKVKNEVLVYHEEKQKEMLAETTQRSKDVHAQGEYSQRNRAETLEKENQIVSEAYKQIKDILEDRGDYQYKNLDFNNNTPQKGSFNPSYGNSSSQNNKNNVLLMRNTDSEQQITFEGRMSSQHQQTQGDQFDYNLHQNLVKKLCSLQEKVKSYEKILDEKLSLDKSERNHDQRRIDELEEEKLFFQVERENYLIEKDQLIQQIIQMEDQIMKVCKDMQENNTQSQINSTGLGYLGITERQNKTQLLSQNQGNLSYLGSRNFSGDHMFKTIKSEQIEQENLILKDSNAGLRLEIEQIVIDMKEQQDRIVRLEEEHSQTLILADQTLLDLEQAIKQKEIFQAENNQLQNVVQNLEKILQEHRDEILKKDETCRLKCQGSLDELKKVTLELNDKNILVSNLKKKVEDNESILQDYCEIIAASRASKSDEDRQFAYKSQVENILSLMSKSLEQYSLRQSQSFTGKYKGFLEENYAIKIFIQKFQLFQEKVSTLFRSTLHLFSKIDNIISSQNSSNRSTKSVSPLIELKHKNEYSMSRSPFKENGSLYSNNSNNVSINSNQLQEPYKLNQNSLISEFPDSLDDMEQEFQKYSNFITENLSRKDQGQGVQFKALKFSRILNEIAEQLITNANQSDDIIINKLHRLFDNSQQKNMIVAEFQLILMSVLKHWKRSILETSEVYYELSFYLKQLVEEKDSLSMSSQQYTQIKKPDLAKNISILTQNDFFNEVMEKMKQIETRYLEEQKNATNDNTSYKNLKSKLLLIFKNGTDNLCNSIDNLKERLLIESNNITQIKPFVTSMTEKNQYVKLLQQFNLYLTSLQEADDSKYITIISKSFFSYLKYSFLNRIQKQFKFNIRKQKFQQLNIIIFYQ